MAELRLDLVKRIEELSKTGNVELFVGLQRLNNKEVQDLRRLLNCIGEVIAKKRSTKPSIRHTINRKERVAGILKALSKNLSSYENTDEIDEWTIKVDVLTEYQLLTLDELINYHQSLLHSSYAMNNIKLLVHYERGRFYSFMEVRHSYEWKTFCKEQLRVCATTARCHIDFYQIIRSYPRLMVCQLSFETIISYKKEILDYIKRQDNDLSERLSLPLREIESDINIKIPTNVGQALDITLDFDGTMNAAWEIDHELIDEQVETLPSNIEWADAVDYENEEDPIHP